MKSRLWTLLALLMMGFGLTLMLAAKERVAAVEPEKNQTPKEKQQLLEALGTVVASHYYQTYLNIGLIADGKAEGIYGEKDARKVLETVLPLLATVDKQLEKVGQLNLEKEDRASLEQMRKLSALLREQGKELQAFWETGDQAHSDRYETFRKNSWAEIRKLLGLNK